MQWGVVAVSLALAPSVVGLLGYSQLVCLLPVDVLIFADFPALLMICGDTLSEVVACTLF